MYSNSPKDSSVGVLTLLRYSLLFLMLYTHFLDLFVVIMCINQLTSPLIFFLVLCCLLNIFKLKAHLRNLAFFFFSPPFYLYLTKLWKFVSKVSVLPPEMRGGGPLSSGDYSQFFTSSTHFKVSMSTLWKEWSGLLEDSSCS